jgi:uncharacterized protein (DUF433 family)
MEFQHITCNPKILGGKACIRGTRISVELILEWIANGSTIAEICDEFDQLSREAVREAILYAGQRSRNEFFYEVKAA